MKKKIYNPYFELKKIRNQVIII